MLLFIFWWKNLRINTRGHSISIYVSRALSRVLQLETAHCVPRPLVICGVADVSLFTSRTRLVQGLLTH